MMHSHNIFFLHYGEDSSPFCQLQSASIRTCLLITGPQKGCSAQTKHDLAWAPLPCFELQFAHVIVKVGALNLQVLPCSPLHFALQQHVADMIHGRLHREAKDCADRLWKTHCRQSTIFMSTVHELSCISVWLCLLLVSSIDCLHTLICLHRHLPRQHLCCCSP